MLKYKLRKRFLIYMCSPHLRTPPFKKKNNKIIKLNQMNLPSFSLFSKRPTCLCYLKYYSNYQLLLMTIETL